MTTTHDVVRAAIPEADDSLCSHILWGRTPFPVGRITAQSLFRAASRYRRAREHGIVMCGWCDRIAEPGKWECASCDEALSRAAQEN